MKVLDLTTNEVGRLENYRYRLAEPESEEAAEALVEEDTAEEVCQCDPFQELVDPNRKDFITFTDSDGDHHAFCMKNIISIHLRTVETEEEAEEDEE